MPCLFTVFGIGDVYYHVDITDIKIWKGMQGVCNVGEDRSCSRRCVHHIVPKWEQL